MFNECNHDSLDGQETECTPALRKTCIWSLSSDEDPGMIPMTDLLMLLILPPIELISLLRYLPLTQDVADFSWLTFHVSAWDPGGYS
jgi:hypothetical protein